MSTPGTTEQPPLAENVAMLKSNSQQFRLLVRQAFDEARKEALPDKWRETLEYVRGIQDDLESYVAFAVALKGGYVRAAADRKDEYDEAWARQVDASNRRSSGDDYEGARERYARFDLKVFDKLRAYRQAEKDLALCAELLDEMWLRYRAVNATREDIHQILRAYAFEKALER